MGRLEWIVPLVVMVVYVLGAILKAKEQGNPQPQQPVRRNPGQELDRFLQEIDRLRQQQENRGPTAPSKTEDDDDDEMPTAQRPVVVVREMPPSPMLPRQVVMRVQPAPAPLPRNPEPAARSVHAELMALSPIVAPARSAGPNPAVMALHMLRSRKTVATAFVLNEVLGPPKCKR